MIIFQDVRFYYIYVINFITRYVITIGKNYMYNIIDDGVNNKCSAFTER